MGPQSPYGLKFTRYRQCFCCIACCTDIDSDCCSSTANGSAAVMPSWFTASSDADAAAAALVADGLGAGGNAAYLPCARRHPSYGSKHPDPSLYRSPLIGQCRAMCLPPRPAAVVHLAALDSERKLHL